MQHDNGGRILGRRTDHAVFEVGAVDAEEAGGCEGHVVTPVLLVMPALWRPGRLVFPQLETLDLSGRGLRQGLNHIDPARILPRADLLLDMLLERFMQSVDLI